MRQKCETAPHRLGMGPGYALYSVIDFIVDNYQPVAERLQARFQELEQEIFDKSFDRESIGKLYKLKGELIKLRDAVGPINDISSQLIRFHEDVVRKELRPYFRDIEDHVSRITKGVDTIREMLTTAIQVNLALVTVGQNEVVKRLAGWGAILAIPTVVFSMYGMNFRFMPELGGRFAYPLVVGGDAAGLRAAVPAAGAGGVDLGRAFFSDAPAVSPGSPPRSGRGPPRPPAGASPGCWPGPCRGSCRPSSPGLAAPAAARSHRRSWGRRCRESSSTQPAQKVHS